MKAGLTSTKLSSGWLNVGPKGSRIFDQVSGIIWQAIKIPKFTNSSKLLKDTVRKGVQNISIFQTC